MTKSLAKNTLIQNSKIKKFKHESYQKNFFSHNNGRETHRH